MPCNNDAVTCGKWTNGEQFAMIHLLYLDDAGDDRFVGGVIG